MLRLIIHRSLLVSPLAMLSGHYVNGSRTLWLPSHSGYGECEFSECGLSQWKRLCGEDLGSVFTFDAYFLLSSFFLIILIDCCAFSFVGTTFPQSWIWFQSNHFDHSEGNFLMPSLSSLFLPSPCPLSPLSPSLTTSPGFTIGTSLSFSVASVPFYGLHFPGFVVALYHEGSLHRFATYTVPPSTILTPLPPSHSLAHSLSSHRNREPS